MNCFCFCTVFGVFFVETFWEKIVVLKESRILFSSFDYILNDYNLAIINKLRLIKLTKVGSFYDVIFKLTFRCFRNIQVRRMLCFTDTNLKIFHRCTKIALKVLNSEYEGEREREREKKRFLPIHPSKHVR